MEWSAADLTAKVLRHERTVIACTVALLAALSWAYLVRGMQMPAMQMPGMQPPLPALIAMWWLMMLAMMLPSAAPAILLYARVRRSRSGDGVIAQTWVFLAGYLAVWLVFSVAATLLQSAIADSSMRLSGDTAASSLLILAGAYQLSPFKSACLSQCRSPAQFISRHWRSGPDGAVRLGVLHGGYCMGCCWLLMSLLFVGGVMNLFWVIGLTVLVAAEKLLPAGQFLQRISGAALILWGLWRFLA